MKIMLILLNFITRRFDDEKVIWLIKEILENEKEVQGKRMPLGNLTSQFFANVYLHEFDFFVKHKLNIKYYIRYVDDFVILHFSREQLKEWKEIIHDFLEQKLKLELHPDKSKIVSLSQGIHFVGFRNFYYFKLLRKRNIKNMENKLGRYIEGEISFEKIIGIFQGWQAYAMWANTNSLIKKIDRKFQIENYKSN